MTSERQCAVARTGSASPQPGHILWLWLEFALLFTGLPLFLFYLQQGWILPFLWIAALGCLLCLWRDPVFDRSCLWRHGALRQAGLAFYGRILAANLALAALLYLLAPHLLFSLPQQRPGLWLMVMLFYPILSVYPQELIYRAFFFYRYAPLFPGVHCRIAVSALSFGFMHIIFHNWIAVILTTIGGILFARSYVRSRSIALSSWEHTLYGCLLFTLGLGPFFYSGGLAEIPGLLRF